MCKNSPPSPGLHPSRIQRNMSGNVIKHTFGHVHPAKIQISQRIRTVWPKASLDAFWTAKGAKFLHVDNEEWSDYSRLIWVVVGTYVRRYIYSCCESNNCIAIKCQKGPIKYPLFNVLACTLIFPRKRFEPQGRLRSRKTITRKSHVLTGSRRSLVVKDHRNDVTIILRAHDLTITFRAHDSEQYAKAAVFATCWRNNPSRSSQSN